MQDFLYKIGKNPRFCSLSCISEYTETVMFRSSRNGFSIRESRLTYERESSFGDHMKEYGRDVRDTYFTGKEGIVDQTLGAVGAVANVALKGTDQLYKGIVGQRYNSPHGIAGHTIADTKSLIKNVFTLHPLRALGDASSLVFSDVPMDAVNLLTGNGLNNGRHSTRSAIDKTLAA